MGECQVCHELGVVESIEAIDAFKFENHGVVHEEVDAIAALNEVALVHDRECKPAACKGSRA